MLKKPFIRFAISLIVVGIILFAVLELRAIIMPFLVGYIFHFALKPFVNFFSRRGMKHRLSVTVVFLSAFLIAAVFFKLFIPAIISEFHDIQDNIPVYSQELEDKIAVLENSLPEGISSFFPSDAPDGETDSFIKKYISGYFIDVLKKLPGLVLSYLPFFLYLFIIPFATFFFLLDEYKIKKAFIDNVPNMYFETSLNLMHSLNRQFGLLLGGMLITVTLMSFIISVLLYFIGLDFPIIVGIFSGVANLIPYAGPVVGTFSGFIVALMTGAPNSMYLYVILIFVAANLIENVFIQPIIYAKAANIHPLMVIFLVLGGSRYGGIIGMLVAVPIASLLQVTVRILYREVARPSRPDFSLYRDITSDCSAPVE